MHSCADEVIERDGASSSRVSCGSSMAARCSRAAAKRAGDWVPQYQTHLMNLARLSLH